MVQTRDKIAASLVVAAMVAFGVVVAPTTIDPKANAHDATSVEVAPIAEVKHVVADDYTLDEVPDEVVNNGDGTEAAIVKGNDAVTKVTDEGTDGLGESVAIVIAPEGTY
jgi:hypothetical protein